MSSDVYRHRIWLAAGFLLAAVLVLFCSRGTFFDGWTCAWFTVSAMAQGIEWVSERIARGGKTLETPRC